VAVSLWRTVIVTHRYLGVAVGLLMLGWFVSGIVMMYVAYPELSQTERQRVLGPIPWQAISALDKQKFTDGQPVQAVQIEALLGTPMVRVKPEGQPFIINDLRTGGLPEIDATKARAIALDAARRIIGTNAPIVTSESIQQDQWTVAEDYDNDRPLYHFVFADPARTNLYVSSATGAVVLWTTRPQRFWNWLGAIPHWLYFTRLRSNGPLWSQIVIWTSILGGFLTALGLYIGILQFTPGRGSPYRGWHYWHHIAGLFFGVVALAFVVSGTLSMNPWGFLEGRGGNERLRLAGEPLPWSAFRDSLAALKANPPPGDIVILMSAPLNGKLFWLVARPDGTIDRFAEDGTPAPIREADLAQAAQRLAGPNAIESQGMMNAEDDYYFGLGDKPSLPVYRVILNDAEHTRYYLNPKTAGLLQKVDSGRRGYRWLFDGIHRLDFFAWLRVRPIWDAILISLMLGGGALTATGSYLAIWRIKRDLTFKRRRRPLQSFGPPPPQERGRKDYSAS
jgi:PepSY-associated transmembrane protein